YFGLLPKAQAVSPLPDGGYPGGNTAGAECLVVRDKEGKPYSVRYDQVNAMLLNEFLKEHCKVEQLTKDFQSKLAEQQKQIEGLTTGLQKVSAQLEASKPAPQMVNNP